MPVLSTSKKSLKFKLIFLSMGITFLLGVVSMSVLRYIVHTQEETQLNTFEAYAQTLNDAIAAQFFERYGDIQAFAISPAIQDSNQKVIVEMLNTFSAMYGIYDLIMVVDAKGHLVAVNSKSPEGKDIPVKAMYQKNYSNAPWFKAVMTGELTEDKEKGFSGTFVEGIHVDPWTTEVYGAKRLGNSFSAAVKDASGKVIGVITNRAASRWFETAFRETYAGMKKSGFGHSEVKLLNKDGTLLFAYTSNPAQEKLDDPKFDWNQLLKTNLIEGKIQAAQNVVSGESGSMLEKVVPGQPLQMVGYVPMSGPKFVDKLGWYIIVHDDQSEANAMLIRVEKIFFLIFAIVMGLSCAVSYFFAIGLSRRLSDLAARLSHGSSEVFSSSTKIAQSSTQLSEAATEQASAIQETAASIDEVSSMVKKSADNAAQSQSVSRSSRTAAEQGQQAVEEMSHAINDISQSNAAIMTQVEEGNRQISEIVKVISEIGNKTKVINDIVFQTKLLSFNASVEAARAGEHGKGFAVVAEEVGNLAQMSGNAAKEISAMLESSIQKVESIIVETKSRVEHLVVESRSKVEAGTHIAKKCGEVLTNILTTVQEVDGMVGEISSASQEQAQGVSEINKAMNQLDQVTQQNSAISQTAASSAEELNSEAQLLRQMVQDLFLVINGSGATGHSPGSSLAENHSVVSTPSNGHTNTENLEKFKNVTPIRKKQTASPKRATAAPIKLAAGAESFQGAAQLPSKDDPRFEDV